MGSANNKHAVAGSSSVSGQYRQTNTVNSSAKRRRANITEKDTPKNSSELKQYLKKCVRDGKMVTLEVGEQEKGWRDCRELETTDLVVIDCKILKEEKLKKRNQKKNDLKTNAVLSQDQKIQVEHKMNALQKRIGKSPKLLIEKFENWAGTQMGEAITCSPITKEEIQSVIIAAADENIGIRCVGSAHSWAPVILDDRIQILMRLGNLKSDYGDGSRIRISNRQRNEVDVMAGVLSSELKDFQLENKIHMPTNALYDGFHVVSLLATGCHGVGRNVKCLSDYAVKMRIFDSTGRLRTYHVEDQAMFRAVSANFGCFGIIFDVTLKLEPEIIVKTENLYYNLKDVFYNTKNMKSLLENNWSVQIFWFPYNTVGECDYDPKDDDLWVRVINKVTENVETEGWSYYLWKDTKDWLSQQALDAVAECMVDDPSTSPFYAWSAWKALKNVLYPSGHLYQELPHAVHYRKYVDTQEIHDMEFIFDIQDNYNLLLKIIEVVVNKVDHHEEKTEYPLNLTLEMRWMAYSDAYLGTGILANPAAGGSGNVMCIEIVSIIDTQGWEKFSTDIAESWMEMGGVPHLAKEWHYIPGIYEHIHSKMKVPIQAFKRQLEKSGADPNGIFINYGMKKLLNM